MITRQGGANDYKVMRLDLLTASVCGLKKAKARALIDTGTVTVDGVVCTSYGQVCPPKWLPFFVFVQVAEHTRSLLFRTAMYI